MAKIFIDNIPYEVKDGQNLLHACLSLGFDIPYFCWHPALHSVGACRQCAVKQFKDENDTRGRIVMSCMTPAAEGTRISINDPDVLVFRRRVIEWMMTNHPHDCPVCDEGGECHLQDMTVMTGHDYRRFRFRKRTFENQDLGPFLNHEMNRCIQCYRCVRFYRDYAGGRDLDVFAAHNHVFFGRQKDGILINEFSGNLAEVCPTGVFTDKTFKEHYARKWDLQTAPSICVHCGLGCNTIASERSGSLRRIQNRYHHEVNGYFLCDRGRFGYGFVNDPGRLRTPLLRLHKGARQAEATREEILRKLQGILFFGARVIGIGSPRASLEANFCLRTLVGEERFFAGVDAGEHKLVSLVIDFLKKGPCRTASLKDAERSDAVFVLGEDVTNTAPRLALALRQAVRNRPLEAARSLHIPQWNDAAVRNAIQDDRGPLFIAAVQLTKLDDAASGSWHAAPEDIARLGYAVAHEIDSACPEVSCSPEMAGMVKRIASALLAAERPLVVSGTGCLSEAVIRSAHQVASALHRRKKEALLSFVVPECNSMGLAMMTGRNLREAVDMVKGHSADVIIVLENDLFRRAGEREIEDLFEKASHVIVLDHTVSGTADRADIVMPAGTFVEAQGTFVSSEGRAQRSFKVFMPEGEVRESWRWLTDMIELAGRPEGKAWRSIDHVVKALAEAVPAFGDVLHAAPQRGFRVEGLRIPRQPHRASGRTAVSAHMDVHEPGPPVDSDSPFSFSMEGFEGMPPPALIQRYWRPGWNSVQALNKFQQEVGGELRGGDPGVRLIEPGGPHDAGCEGDVPPAFEPGEGKFLLLPLYHIFGSEELSGRVACIAQRAPLPYCGLNKEDAAAMGASGGDLIEVVTEGGRLALLAKICEGIPRGTAGIPVGLRGVQRSGLPAWAEIVLRERRDD